MPIDRRRALATLTLAIALAGCATDGENYLAGVDPTWGEANRQTMAAQIIDPAPRYDTAVPETSGDHAAQAIDRYNKDKVKKPDHVRTSSSTTGSGSSGSGSGN